MPRLKFYNEKTQQWDPISTKGDRGRPGDNYILTHEDMIEIANIVADLVDIQDGVDVSDAEVGQVLAVKSVDGNGKPTEWETVDLIDDPEIAAIYDLAEAGYIEPVTDTDNSVFIDETGSVYIY